MGIKDFLEDAAGALAAEKGLDALDPNAGLLEKGAALVAGYEGTDFLKDKVGELLGGGHQEQPETDASSDQGFTDIADQQSDDQDNA